MRYVRAAYRMLGLPRPPAPMVQETLLRQLHADLMFCPFGGSHACDGTVPMVALWNDLTLLHYPQFLSPSQRAASETLFKQAIYQADKVICFSAHARTEILTIAQVEEQRVASLRPRPMTRLPHQSQADVAAILNQLGVTQDHYLYSPGEFTEEGNHKLLLVALGIFRQRHPRTELKIVFSGSANAARRELQDAAAKMGLMDQLVFADVELPRHQAALLQGCQAVLMPFLEATAAPLLFQAIEFSKPVLCSDLADLPESIRSAALVFDPTKVTEIVNVLERLTGATELVGELAERSHRQAGLLGGASHLAGDMVDVLEDVLHSSHRARNSIKTVYPDQWTSERILVTCMAAAEARTLHLTLETPEWFPWGYQRVHLLTNRNTTGRMYKLKRGKRLTIERPLPREGGCLEFLLDPPLIPAALGLGGDDRLLGCICRECTITGLSKTTALHPAGEAKP
jgi:glycosyltransferase involved in cell wall biosynthesis